MKTHLNHINTQKVRYTFEEMTTESLNQFFLHQDVSRANPEIWTLVLTN